MRRLRFTISRWMVATAALGVNIAAARAFVLAERRGEHLDLVAPGFLIFFALQFGLWRFLRTQGRRRRFWLGFAAGGAVATMAMLIAALVDGGLCDWFFSNWYTDVASELSYHFLPTKVYAALVHEHWDWFLAVNCFLPELFAAALAGLLSASLSGPIRGTRPGSEIQAAIP